MSAHDELQHCYRHPDRETALACSNCGRPICPECMTATPVGQRCPECIGQQRTQVRRPSSMALRDAVVTYALIAACVLMFLGPQKGLSGGLGVRRRHQPAVVIDFALVGPPVANGDWWRMVTSMFLHGSILHLGFNMYALWIFGPAHRAPVRPARYLAPVPRGRPVGQRRRADPVAERLHRRRLGRDLRPDGRLRRDREGAGRA